VQWRRQEQYRCAALRHPEPMNFNPDEAAQRIAAAT